MNKLAIITAFLGETRNRYMVYQGNRTLAEKFEMAKTIPGLDGFELCYPADFENPAELKALLRQYGFGLSGMNFRSRRTGKWWRVRKEGDQFNCSDRWIRWCPGGNSRDRRAGFHPRRSGSRSRWSRWRRRRGYRGQFNRWERRVYRFFAYHMGNPNR
jgi:hypothetical protein